MMHGYGMMAGMGWLGMGTMLLIWIAVIALVLWGVTSLFPQRRSPAEPDALEIVRRRFARGEISQEEYHQAIAALRTPEYVADGHALNRGAQ